MLQSGSESQYFSSSSEAYHSDGSESGDYVFDDFMNFMNSKYSVNDILQYNVCLDIIAETCIIICLAHKCINCLVLWFKLLYFISCLMDVSIASQYFFFSDDPCNNSYEASSWQREPVQFPTDYQNGKWHWTALFPSNKKPFSRGLLNFLIFDCTHHSFHLWYEDFTIIIYPFLLVLDAYNQSMWQASMHPGSYQYGKF